MLDDFGDSTPGLLRIGEEDDVVSEAYAEHPLAVSRSASEIADQAARSRSYVCTRCSDMVDLSG